MDKTTFVYIKKSPTDEMRDVENFTTRATLAPLGPLPISDHYRPRDPAQKTYPSVPLPGQPAAGPSRFIPIIGICGRGGA